MPLKRSKILKDDGDRVKLYEDLKGTTTSRPSTFCLDFSNYKKATSTTESETKLREILNEISENCRQRTEYYAILGLELANLKRLNIRIICGACRIKTNMYEILDCQTCNSKRNPTKNYYATVKHITGYSKDYVNFLIAFGRLCHEYPRFLRVTMSTDDIKNKIGMPYLRKRIAEDATYWKQVL